MREVTCSLPKMLARCPLHCAVVDGEGQRDFAVGAAFGDAAQHVQFAIAERFDLGRFGETGDDFGGNFGVDEALARGQILDAAANRCWALS
ncbi:MAG: hypothetical protein R2873_26795 [Caldilineaceae bacterium]